MQVRNSHPHLIALITLSVCFVVIVLYMLKPNMSEGVKFTRLSNNIDRAWYEIRLAPLRGLPTTVKIGRVPGMAYFIGITLMAKDCETLSRNLALQLNVRVSDTHGKQRDAQSINSWVASYPPSGALTGWKRSCTLYGRERNTVNLSRFKTLAIEVSVEGAWQALPHDAEIVLDGIE
jgi:hypothetical protein